MNTINNRFLKTIEWISLYMDALSVHISIFIFTISCKIINWSIVMHTAQL